MVGAARLAGWLVTLALAASAARAAPPPPDPYRTLPYRLGPAALAAQPIPGSAPDLKGGYPRETHRRVRIRIDGARAVCRIHQVFFNGSPVTQEVRLLVPDPAPGTVEMTPRSPLAPAGETLTATSAEAAATALHAAALEGGNPGGLHAYPGPARISGPFRLPPRSYVKVDWRFEVQVEAPEHGLSILGLTPGGRPPAELSLNALEVDVPEALRGHFFSPTHRLSRRAGGPGRLVLAPTRARLDPAEPFLLIWPPHQGRAGVVLGADPEGQDHALVVAPSRDVAASTRPRAWVVVVDAGGSLHGEPWTRRVDEVRRLLELLGPEDRMDLVPFGLYPQPLHRTLVPATEPARRAALDRLRARTPYGAVNFEAALQTALEIAEGAPDTHQPAVLVLTDGRPTMGESQARRILDPQAVPAPIFPFARGPDADYYFLEQLARFSGGRTFYDPDTFERLDELVDRIRPAQRSPPVSIRLDGQRLDLPAEDRVDGPRLATFVVPAGVREVEVEGQALARSSLARAGPLAARIHSRREAGRAVWEAIEGAGKFPGGADSFKLLGLVPGTPRHRILGVLSDGVGPLGRDRVMALAGLLDQGAFEPVDPGVGRTWSGDRFFQRDEDGRWLESGLSALSVTTVGYGSEAHRALVADPGLGPHLSLWRSVGLILSTTAATIVDVEATR